MNEYVFRAGGKVALRVPDNDPAVERILGHSRFWLGMDLGRSDPSALVLLHDEQLPVYDGSRQVLGQRTRTVVWADRLGDTAYTDLSRHVAVLLAKPTLQRRTKFIIDASGLGQPFSDVLTEGGIEHYAATMTAGQAWKKKGRKITVAKNVLLETLATGFETGALTIAHDLPLKDQLLTEVQSFELGQTSAGNLILQGGGKGHHADMAIALALAYFGTMHLMPSYVGQYKLRGWY
jgi:hypothetical protein